MNAKFPHPHTRFGQDPGDTADLVRCWNDTRPHAPNDWSNFWTETTARLDAPGSSHSGRTAVLRWVAAAALIGMVSFAWNRSVRVSDPMGGVEAQNAGSFAESRVATLEPVLVSIEIHEKDEVAVIRLDDLHCPAQNPCTESVETYGVEDPFGTALASNFRLFNELESLASD